MNNKGIKTMKPMLAKKYTGQKVDGWLMSEKLDGVRAIWTGSELISRNGNRFNAPGWFTAALPAGECLDGELYIGRGLFQKTVGPIRKKVPDDAEWQKIRFCVFDAPSAAGGFDDRLEYCQKILTGSQVASVVEHTICRGKKHLQEYFTEIVKAGAEGVMLRRAGSAYERSRSNNLLKVKEQQSDEAKVIGHVEGEGRHFGRLGALVCRWAGVVFNVGTGFTDAQRECPPQIGSTITFSFFEVTDGGSPRFPVFLAERNYE